MTDRVSAVSDARCSELTVRTPITPVDIDRHRLSRAAVAQSTNQLAASLVTSKTSSPAVDGMCLTARRDRAVDRWYVRAAADARGT